MKTNKDFSLRYLLLGVFLQFVGRPGPATRPVDLRFGGARLGGPAVCIQTLVETVLTAVWVTGGGRNATVVRDSGERQCSLARPVGRACTVLGPPHRPGPHTQHHSRPSRVDILPHHHQGRGRVCRSDSNTRTKTNMMTGRVSGPGQV